MLNPLNFQQHLLLLSSCNHRQNSGTQIIAAIWQTVHEDMVADVFRSKKSSSALLVHEQQK